MSIKFYEEIGGYNIDSFVGKSQDELNTFKCGICHEVYRDPKQCCVGHVYCGSCVESLSSVSLEEVGKRCPECRTVFENWIPSLFARNQIDSMRVRCVSTLSNANDLHVAKCEWQGSLCTLQRHVDTECQLTSVMCGLVGCEAQMIRADLPGHEQHCLFRLTKCIYCESAVTIRAQIQHQEACELRPVSCDQNCGKRMTVNQLNLHKAQDCPNTVVDCPMHQLVDSCSGCTGKVERCKVQLHLTNQNVLANNFMALLSHSVETTEGTNQLTKELDETKQKCETHQAVTNMKFVIASLQQYTKQLFAQSSDKRWQHDAMLCEMLEKWSKQWETDGDTETIKQITDQLSIVNVDSGIIVRHVAVEFRFEELDAVYCKITDVSISDTMTLRVILWRNYSINTTPGFCVFLSTYPLPMAVHHCSVVQFQKPELVVLPMSNWENRIEGISTATNITETVRLLCTVHLRKREFKKHDVKLYGDDDAN